MPSAKPTLVQLAPLSVAIHSRPAPSKATLSGAANQPFSVVSGLYFAACSGASGLPAMIGMSQVKLSAAWFALPSSASGGVMAMMWPKMFLARGLGFGIGAMGEGGAQSM